MWGGDFEESPFPFPSTPPLNFQGTFSSSIPIQLSGMPRIITRQNIFQIQVAPDLTKIEYNEGEYGRIRVYFLICLNCCRAPSPWLKVLGEKASTLQPLEGEEPGKCLPEVPFLPNSTLAFCLYRQSSISAAHKLATTYMNTTESMSASYR